MSKRTGIRHHPPADLQEALPKDQLRSRLEAGEHPKDIGKSHNLGLREVWSLAAYYDVKVRGDKPLAEDHDWIVQMAAEGVSNSDMAIALGTYHSDIRWYLRQHRIVRLSRSNSTARYNPSTAVESLGAPEESTEALPGSEEKIRVLCARAELGLDLWHPEDAVYDMGPLHDFEETVFDEDD